MVNAISKLSLIGAFTPLASAIVGGAVAAPGRFPSMVSVEYFGSHLCGGVILGPRHILTAASCLVYSSASSISIEAGTPYIDIVDFQFAWATKLISHPDFDDEGRGNDIAVIVLEDGLKFTDSVQPASLPSPSSEPASGSRLTLAGWGATVEGGSTTRSLRVANLDLIDRKACSEARADDVAADEFCDGLDGGGRGGCAGDNGGPVFQDGVLVGIQSAPGCGKSDRPDVNTIVGSHMDWILEQIRDGELSQEEL